MTNTNYRWGAEAELAMMGFPIPVDDSTHLTYLVRHCLKTLKSDVYGDNASLSTRTMEIIDNAMNKYNSGKDKSIKWFVVNDSMFGVMMTFVRSKGDLTLKSGKMKANGVLAWVENIDAPGCSELGSVFFEKRNGKTVRIG